MECIIKRNIEMLKTYIEIYNIKNSGIKIEWNDEKGYHVNENLERKIKNYLIAKHNKYLEQHETLKNIFKDFDKKKILKDGLSNE